MRRLAALALIMGAVAWARTLGSVSGSPSAGTALAVGFTLLGAWIAGDLLRRLRLPRLTGYLLFGVLAGPYGSGGSGGRAQPRGANRGPGPQRGTTADGYARADRLAV